MRQIIRAKGGAAKNTVKKGKTNHRTSGCILDANLRRDGALRVHEEHLQLHSKDNPTQTWRETFKGDSLKTGKHKNHRKDYQCLECRSKPQGDPLPTN